MSTTSSKKSLSAIGISLIVLGSLIAANIIVGQLRGVKIDLTEGNIYSLSGGTREILRELERPVELRLYYSRSNEAMPVHLKQYAERVEDLLEEINGQGKNKITLTHIDPKPLSDDEEWARKYGLNPLQGGTMGADAFYFGLVAISGTNEQVLPFLSPQEEERLEYNLARLVFEVSRTQKPKVGIFSSFPIFGTPQMPQQMMMMQQQQPQPAWMVISQLQQLFEVEQIQSLDAPLPSDLESLVVIHPKELSEAAQYHLDQYVVNGGKLIAMIDPMSVVDQMNTPQQQLQQQRMMGMEMNFSSDLGPLLIKWGVDYDSTKVIADRELAAQHTAQGSGVRSPTWLMVRKPHFNEAEIPTQGLEAVQIGIAGGMNINDVEGIAATPLLSSSGESSLITTMMAGGNPQQVMQQLKPDGTVRHIALSLFGKFPSAFEKAPGEDTDPSTHVAKGTVDANVVVIADVDWIYDALVAQRFNFMGQTVVQPMGDNLNLFLNLIEQSVGNTALLSLRSRGTFQRPFTVINDKLKQAEAESLEEMQKLQDSLHQANTRLSEMAQQVNGDALTLNQALQEEQQKLNDQTFQMSRQLREIEKERRADVERLQFRLQVLNIAAVPLLVGLFGLVRGLARRNKSNHSA